MMLTTTAKRVFSAPFVYYNGLLERRPVFTKCITSGIMYGGGDIIAQYTETYNLNRQRPDGTPEHHTVINKTRVLIFFLFGSTIAGVAYNYWFNYLNELPQLLWRMKQTRHRGKILRAYAYLKAHGIDVKLDLAKLPHAAPLTKWKSKAAKILADQLIFSSTYTLVFFMSIGVLQGTADRIELEYFSGDDAIITTHCDGNNSESTDNTSTDDNSSRMNSGTVSGTPSPPVRNLLDEEDPDSILVRGQGGKGDNGLTFKAYHHTPRPKDSSSTTAMVPPPPPSTGGDSPTQSRSKLMEAIARLNEFLVENNNSPENGSPYGPSSSPSTVTTPTGSPSESEEEREERQRLEDDEARLIAQVVRKLRIAHAIKSKALTWEEIWFKSWEHTKEVYLSTYLADCVVWPPLQLINFTFIPLRFQFLYVNVANLAWNTFLSLMANKKH